MFARQKVHSLVTEECTFRNGEVSSLKMNARKHDGVLSATKVSL